MSERIDPAVAVLHVESGELTVDILQTRLCELNGLGRPVVLDLSAATLRLSEVDALLLVLQLEELDSLRQHGLAVVAHPVDTGQVDRLVSAGRFRGCRIRRFDDQGMARQWVSQPGATPATGADQPPFN